jgi:3-hydroxyisobutyrate dehydrogenase-like beta-hydroxyacid dehydrogenase
MGHAFAANLIADGASVTVYDRRPDVATPLAACGAAAAKDIADFAGCEIVLTSLPDDDVVRHVAVGAEGLAGVLRQGAIHVSMSTISVALSRELGQAHRARSQVLLQPPCWVIQIWPRRGNCSFWLAAQQMISDVAFQCLSAWVSACSRWQKTRDWPA